MNIKFNRYPRMKHASKIEDILYIKKTVSSEEEWYVTEKIHGANFQVTGSYTEDGFIVKLGSRNSFTDDSFFNLSNSAKFLNTLERVKSLIRVVSETQGTAAITVFGEVFGGNIQKGIFYSEDKDFIAFDIVVDGRYKDRNYFEEVCSIYKVPYVKTLLRGTLDECLEYPNTFDSTIPEVHRKDNVCEGVVIRPISPLYIYGDAVLLKNKNSKWLEKSRLPPKPQKELSASELEIYKRLDNYVNENRVLSAISKEGNTMNRIPFIMKELNKDILLEYADDFNLGILDKDVNKVYKTFNKRLITMVKKHLL